MLQFGDFSQRLLGERRYRWGAMSMRAPYLREIIDKELHALSEENVERVNAKKRYVMKR